MLPSGLKVANRFISKTINTSTEIKMICNSFRLKINICASEMDHLNFKQTRRREMAVDLSEKESMSSGVV